MSTAFIIFKSAVTETRLVSVTRCEEGKVPTEVDRLERDSLDQWSDHVC